MGPAAEESQELSSFSETKSELKNILDSISSPTVSVSLIQELIKSGPSRAISIQDDSITLQMLESGSIYQWSISDPRTAVACLVATGIYEPIETRILQQLAKGSKLIVDIGANVGYYTVELAKLLGPTGQLLSFEPVEASFSQLRKNVKLNRIDNAVRMFQLGVSDSVSQSQIFLPRKSGSSAASLRNLHPQEEFVSQVIQTTTLDHIFETLEITECNLIKIDVEGGELQAIQGAIATITKFNPVIFAELLRKWSKAFAYNPNTVLHILINLGYTCWGVSEALREIISFEETDVETNFLFIHADNLTETLEKLGVAGIEISTH